MSPALLLMIAIDAEIFRQFAQFVKMLETVSLKKKDNDLDWGLTLVLPEAWRVLDKLDWRVPTELLTRCEQAAIRLARSQTLCRDARRAAVHLNLAIEGRLRHSDSFDNMGNWPVASPIPFEEIARMGKMEVCVATTDHYCSTNHDRPPPALFATSACALADHFGVTETHDPFLFYYLRVMLGKCLRHPHYAALHGVIRAWLQRRNLSEDPGPPPDELNEDFE